MQFSPQKQRFIDAATDMFGGGSVINKQQVRDASAKAGTPLAGWFMKQFKTGYNQFELPTEGGEVAPVAPVQSPVQTPVQTAVRVVRLHQFYQLHQFSHQFRLR